MERAMKPAMTRALRRVVCRVVRRTWARRVRLLMMAGVLAHAMLYSPTQVRADVIFHVPEVLVRHAAVTKPVGTGKPNVTRVNDSDPWAESELVQQRYEYFIEHAVSTADAKKMAKMLKLSEIPETSPGCGKCTKREMEYCETRVLADHCCCERHFLPEPFPWLPHTCYIGPERCAPLAKNCAQYARLRDCCCMKKLAEHWKGILSMASRLSVSGVTLLLLSMVLFTIYL